MTGVFVRSSKYDSWSAVQGVRWRRETRLRFTRLPHPHRRVPPPPKVRVPRESVPHVAAVCPDKRCVISGDVVFLTVAGRSLQAAALRCEVASRGFSGELLPARETRDRRRTVILPFRIFRLTEERGATCAIKVWPLEGKEVVCLVDVLPRRLHNP